MKITGVNTTLVSKPLSEWVGSGHLNPPTSRDILFATIETSDGVSGTGFVTGLGFVGGAEIRVVRHIVATALQHLLIGEEPDFTEKIWDKLFRGTIRFGRKGAVLRAISLVDIALWDLRGQLHQTPLYKLLGAHKEQCAVYGSGGHYQAGEKQYEKLAAEVKEIISYGFKGIKMKVGGASLRTDFERVAYVRDVIGPNVDLMVDANEAWTLHEAVRFANLAEPLNLAWIEEPIANDNLEGYSRLSKATSIPIAAGENEYTRYGFYELIHRGGVLICQPDVTRVGGVTEWTKIANLASAVGVSVVPHGVHELHIQLACSSANVPLLEFFLSGNPIQTFITECISAPEVVKDATGGVMRVPQGPGFGLTFNREIIERYMTD